MNALIKQKRKGGGGGGINVFVGAQEHICIYIQFPHFQDSK